ncbi:hypothetical protein GCK72_015890 [Caenorhabditis remanei]|uniref:Uncharacterized protein n=1 Tax=Caenorhabditis remanei TaxID=31234 RepID=A0A6A5GYF6_CAERE|nr:hypothetical protein GCK72_015890 [Caenorhabditis remanei]KAF1759423.1 hypothetical protein GCK72_015890 [Caenorhabditis remanei]
MNSQDLLSYLKSLPMNELLAQFQTAHDNVTRAQLNADQAKKQSLESQNVELVQQLKNMNMAMGDLITERDVLKEQHAASQSREQGLESQNAELIGQLKKMNMAMSNLIVGRDAYAQAKKVDGDAIRKLQEQHAKELENKDLELQTLKTQLAASQEQHVKELNDKNLVIGDLKTHLSAAEQQSIDKLKVLQEQHAKIENKDQVIQELKTHLPAAEQQTIEKVMELKNENSRLSQEIQNLQEYSLQGEQRVQGTLALLTERLQKQLQVHQKTDPRVKWDEDGILIIQTYLTQLAAIHEDSTKLLKQPRLSSGEQQPVDKIMELANENKRLSLGLQMLTDQKNQSLLKAREGFALRTKHADEIKDKIRDIRDLETRLSAAEQQTIKKLKNKDLELQTLQCKLTACQEQHVKELNDKDRTIQELKTRLSERQIVHTVMVLRNLNNRLSLEVQKLQEESIKAERFHQGQMEILKRALQKKETLRQEKKEVVPELTQFHTELGKLYMELQEAKKPQEALMAQLVDKDKEIEYLMEQLEAKDSEILNLMIQGGDEMNEKAVMADWMAELENGRDGKSE